MQESNLKVIKIISKETMSENIESLYNFDIQPTTNHKSLPQ